MSLENQVDDFNMEKECLTAPQKKWSRVTTQEILELYDGCGNGVEEWLCDISYKDMGGAGRRAFARLFPCQWALSPHICMASSLTTSVSLLTSLVLCLCSHIPFFSKRLTLNTLFVIAIVLLYFFFVVTLLSEILCLLAIFTYYVYCLLLTTRI